MPAPRRQPTLRSEIRPHSTPALGTPAAPRPATDVFPSSSRRTRFGVSTVRGRADAPSAAGRPRAPVLSLRHPPRIALDVPPSHGRRGARLPALREHHHRRVAPRVGRRGHRPESVAVQPLRPPMELVQTTPRGPKSKRHDHVPSTPTPQSFPNPTRLPRAPDLLPERLETPRESTRVKTNTRTPSRTVDTHPPEPAEATKRARESQGSRVARRRSRRRERERSSCLHHVHP